MTPRRLGVLLTLFVLGWSGVYLVVYLYRWEWNRALVSGVFFVAAELALVALMLFRRLQAVETRLARLEDGAGEQVLLGRLREASPGRPPRFRWLDPTAGRMGVFVPVLMGAGVVLSALAFLVERVAGVTAVPVLERGLARRLAELEPPVGFTGTGPPATAPARRSRASELGRGALAVAITGLFVAVGVDALADATQSRPDPSRSRLTTTVDVEILRRNTGRSVADLAEAFWVACRTVLPKDVTATRIEHAGGNRARLELTPGLGEHARRRFFGCLQDATFDRVSAHVVASTNR